MDLPTSVKHYRERSLHNAGLIAALATARVDDASPLTALRERQLALTEDLVHEFAFFARKYIEQADRLGLMMRTASETIVFPTRVGEIDEGDHGLIPNSLWIILGRIIHSDQLAVRLYPIALGDTEPPIFHDCANGLEVRSDRDAPDEGHFVFLDSLVSGFLRLDAQFAEQLGQIVA